MPTSRYCPSTSRSEIKDDYDESDAEDESDESYTIQGYEDDGFVVEDFDESSASDPDSEPESDDSEEEDSTCTRKRKMESFYAQA